MSITGNCTKTGAVVEFIEYGQTFAADLFAVGDTVVIHFAADSFNKDEAFKHPRPTTHQVYVGSDFLDKRAGYAVVKSAGICEVARCRSPDAL